MFRCARAATSLFGRRGLVQTASTTVYPQHIPHQVNYFSSSSSSSSTANNGDRYLHEREMLGVTNPAATAGELKECFLAAIKVAKQQVPGPLLQLKVAELAQALATLTAVAPTSAAVAGAATAATAAADAPSSAASTQVDELHFDTGNYTDNTTETTPAENRARKAHNAARLYKEAMAAKAAGASSASPGTTKRTTKAAEMEIDENQPAWLRQQGELIQAFRLAQAKLNDTAVGTQEEREESFRKSIARINVMTKEYNLNVPMERFQRFIFTERWIENTVNEANGVEKE